MASTDRPRVVWSSLALATILGSSASFAHAHAPLIGRIAVSGDEQSIALALPGFGLVMREGDHSRYLCNALLGAPAVAATQAIGYVADGALLVGTPFGLRILDRHGCDAGIENALRNVWVGEVATDPGSSISYALAGNDTPGHETGLWRSDDNGRSWTLVVALPSAPFVTGMVMSPNDPARVYASATSPAGNAIHRVRDGVLDTMELALPVTLVALQAGSVDRLWATARDERTVGNRGIAILRSEVPIDDSPIVWTELLRVAYFGGLTIDPHGAILVGDELGGVYRSIDDGASFEHRIADVPVACVTSSGTADWLCGSDVLTQPALMRLDGEVAVDVVSIDQVDEQVQCLDVDSVCRAAWMEWERDVLGVGAMDAGLDTLVSDGSAETADAGADAFITVSVDAEPFHASDASTPSAASGCSIRLRSAHWMLRDSACLALSALAARRRRRRQAD